MFTNLKNKFRLYIKTFFDEFEERMLFYIRSESLLKSALFSNNSGISKNLYIQEKRIIISLTTYDKRIHDVYLTIESLMQQTIMPNKIVLWLANEMKNSYIPKTLQNQLSRGLEIRYCKDLRSYKKLIPALKTFPEDIIITVDDDILYNHDFVENLITEYTKEPHCIHCGWAKHLSVGEDGKLMPWKKCPKRPEEEIKKSFLNLPIGCAGVLYPPHSLDMEVFNENVFMNICKYADDIWFKAMTLKAGYPCKAIRKDIHNFMYIDNPICRHQGLTLVNISKDMNNIQIQAVFDKYNLHNLLIDKNQENED